MFDGADNRKRLRCQEALVFLSSQEFLQVCFDFHFCFYVVKFTV